MEKVEERNGNSLHVVKQSSSFFFLHFIGKSRLIANLFSDFCFHKKRAQIVNQYPIVVSILVVAIVKKR